LLAALVLNPRVAEADARIRAALAGRITAAQTPDPDLTLESEYAPHDPHPWLYGFGVNWLLRSSERRRLDLEVARLEISGARLQMLEQIWSVRSALVAALSDWERARRAQTLLDQLTVAQDRVIEIETQRVQGGEDSPSELLFSQSQRIELEQQQVAQRANVADAQASAARALGVPPQALDGLAYAWPDWGAPPPVDAGRLEEMREMALLSRSDLAAAIGDYALAETKLQQAVARQYPQLVLEPGYYWDHGIAKWPFDVGFTLPFNRNKGEIAEARAARDLVGQRMLALQADIFAEITAALRAEQIDRDGAAAARRRVAGAQRQLRDAELGLRLGAVDRHALVDAQIAAMRAELEWLDMCGRLQASRNLLENALHAPLSGPELALPTSLAANASGAGS
jgi:CRISPR system Cascade subunit CasA